MSYNVIEYVIAWLFMAYKMVKKNYGFISNRFGVIHQPDIRTNTPTHGRADDGYRRQRNALHFAYKSYCFPLCLQDARGALMVEVGTAIQAMIW